MGLLASATAYLKLDIKGFEEAIKSAKKALAGLATAFLTFKTAQYFTNGIKDAITFGKEMKIVGDRMGGFDPGNLLLAQKALEQMGYGAEEAQARIGEFIDRSLPIQEIFGGSQNYGKALERAGDTYGKQAKILSRSAESFQMIWNSLQGIASRTQEFFLTLAEKFVKPLAVVADLLNSPIFGEFTDKIGTALSDGAMALIGLFTNGDLFIAFKKGLEFAYMGAKEMLLEGFYEATDFFNIALEKVSKVFTDNLVSEQVSAALTYMFRSAGNSIKSVISESMVILITGFQKVTQTLVKSFTDIALIIALVAAFINPLASIAMSAGIAAANYAADNPDLESVNFFQGEKEKADAQAEIDAGVARDIINGIDFKAISDETANAITSAYNEARSNQKRGENEIVGFKEKNDEAFNSLMEILNKARIAAEEKYEDLKNKNKPPNGSYQQPGTGKIIADSLAKVGGGGGFLRVGMTLTERTAVAALKTAMEQTRQQEAIKINTEKMARNGSPLMQR
jgi:hypothetical protein